MRQSQPNPFLGSLRQVALAIGKREGIKIVFRGSGAATDGKIIYLPASLPADNEELESLLRGYLDHEVGHIKHTDFSLPSPAAPLIHTFTNAFEDIRIEKAMGYEYPGCAINLRETVNTLKASGKIVGPGKKTEPLDAALWAISYGARVAHLRNNLKDEASAYRAAAVKLLGEPVVKVIDHAILEAGSLTSTAKARQLAEQTYDKLKQLLQEPPPQPPQPQPEPDDSEQQQDQDDQGEGEGQGGQGSDQKSDDQQGDDPGDQQSGQQDNSSSNSQDQDGQGKSDDSGESQSNSNSQSSPDGQPEQNSKGSGSGGSMSEKQKKNLQEVLDASEQQLEAIEEKMDLGKLTAKELGNGPEEGNRDGLGQGSDNGMVPTEPAGGAGGGRFEKEVLDAALTTVGLRGKLSGLFQASKLKRDTPQLVGTKIDRRAVHRLAANTPDTRIFEQRREKVNNNTAITVLVDKSGSMHGESIITAMASALSIAKAIDSMPDVECSVGAFPALTSRDGTGVVLAKRFGEKTKPLQFAINASGGTPMHIALRWAGQNLWPRKENRKIVLVLTDGDPDSRHEAKIMADLLKDHGIECHGIGIGSGTERNVRFLFGENSKEIKDISQLADAMFDTLITAMAKRPTR